MLLCSLFNYERELYGGEAENASPPFLVQNKIIGTLAKVQISPYSFVKFKQRDCETGKKKRGLILLRVTRNNSEKTNTINMETLPSLKAMIEA